MVILDTGLLKEHSIFAPVFQLIFNPSTALPKLHKAYGDLILVNFFRSKLLFVCKPEHIEEIYNQEAKGLLSRDFMYDAKKILFGPLVNGSSDTSRPCAVCGTELPRLAHGQRDNLQFLA
jgi:enediyne biosynthesis protein E7